MNLKILALPKRILDEKELSERHVQTCEGLDPAGSLGPFWPVVRSLDR